LRQTFTVELDVFAGRPNPSFPIGKEDFDYIVEEISRLEKSEPVELFDGLGFRGLLLTGERTKLRIQTYLVQKQDENIMFYKSNKALLRKAVAIFNKYDTKQEYKELIEAILE